MTVKTYDEFFIGGSWVPARGSGRIDVTDPATGEVVARVPAGDETDADAAVRAARDAFPGWAATPLEERVALCTAIARRLEEHTESLAAVITSEMGSPLAFSAAVQVALGIIDFAAIADSVQRVEWESELGNSLIVKEPVGVVGAIAPWNYPLHQISAKIASAMAAGCTVVVKTSEITPLSGFVLADVMAEVGVPAGVVNIVTGYGPEIGEAIARHPEVDLVSFTGSPRGGRAVTIAAANGLKPVSLELGGKSPYIVLDDADLEAAVVNGISKAFVNNGQQCTALTRMLVPRTLLEQVEAIVASVVSALVVGDPTDPASQLGPLSSAAHRDRVVDYINLGIEEGARIVVGGPEAPQGLEHGAYVQPTVFSDVTPDMRIAREEIFGPVLVLQPYDDEDDAIRVANDSDYGLGGGVFSSSEERALAVARRLRTGQIEINGAAWNPQAPFGGFKSSGHGRELGPHGIEEFLTTKAMQL